MNGGVVFLIILIFLVLGGYGGWVLYSRMQANKLGLPPPSLNPFASSSSSTTESNYPGPAPVGIKGWFDAQVYKFKNRNNRSAVGAYEASSGAYNDSSAPRGRGAGSRLDPDEAWDARVGNEAYYEEQELGLQDPLHGRSGSGGPASSNPFESSPYGAPSPAFQEPERGRSRTREYDDRNALQNPFGDDHAAASLRGVSPRPLDQHVDTSYGGAASVGAYAPQGQHKKDKSSPTESRRSLFREDI
ncbi:hypothetical protein P280DRAFT_466146 [Massarina eburnea CBS 473.64]|uniref:Acid phosphatase-like protein n=1 Tax=Massarina eburnea CBS 473.64 TaxID=1395130 RepID=A0A6A6SDD6_9PLEO|nr:hypothetical protein P280DRAFT_466146 [Massarina eburnea CBS 473.64]